MSRSRRDPRRGAGHYLAPVAFLAAVTIAVWLVHSALHHHTQPTTTATAPATTPSASRTTTAASKRFYTVQTGDTFGRIAAKEGISVEQLQALNPGVSSNALQVGQKLRVK